MATCNICKYAGTPSYKSPCSECKGFSKYEYEKTQTHGDSIRAMSDEELADIVVCPHTGNWGLCRDDCKKCRLEWLKQPAEVHK